MRIFLSQPIRRQTALLVVTLLTPILAGAVWSANRTRFERRAEVRREAAALAATAAAYLDQSLRGFDSMASALVRDPAVVLLDRAGSDRLFAEVGRDLPLTLNILLTAPDGAIKGSALTFIGPRTTTDLPHVRQVLAGGRPVIGELTVGPISGRPTIFLGYPVHSAAGAVVAVLSFGLDLSHVQETFNAIPLEEGSIVTLTDRAGLVLSRSADGDRFIGTTIDLPSASGADSPRAPVWIDSDGVERVHAVAALSRAPWLMTVGTPTAVVIGRLVPLWRRQLSIVAAGTLASMLLWFWIGSRLSGQLNHLRAAAQRIAQGDLSPVPAVRSQNRELSQLQDAFVTMAENLRQARGELARQIEQERKVRAMLEGLQRQVVRQERLAAVGLLVSGVAHELNNPLQAIMGAAELLERRPELPPDTRQEVALLKTQSYRASEIIRNLSRFSAQQPAPPSAIDIREVVAEVVQLQRVSLDSAQIACEVEARSTGRVLANFTELAQVVLNFVINAQQAIQSAGVPDGRLIIRTVDVDARVRLEVIDNGPGVPVADERKLFQPFFTTKPVGGGTGLGLSVSYGIIESYGGTIGCRSRDGDGAIFYFELPRV